MILLGGIPDIYYNRVLELARKQIKNTEFTGLSLRSYKGQYKIDSPYCEELLATIVAYVEGRPNSLAEGLGVVLLQRDWETQNFDDVFWPFALCRNVRIDQQTSNHGEGRKRAANVYAKHALQAAQKLAGQIRFLSIMFSAQVRRTPVLLPVRRFDSFHLKMLLDEIGASISTVQSPDTFVLAACERFLQKHPRKADGRGVVFENTSGVQFKTPPRNEFHGQHPKFARGQGHNLVCFLAAHVRLGGHYPDGFHYDCRKGNNYSGRFTNCHDAESFYRGNPHLNVYPNDYIR